MTVEFINPTAKRGFYYGWICVLMAAIAMVATLPARSFGQGLFTEHVIADLKLDRVDFTKINFVATLVGALFALGGGKLVDRLGSRIMVTLIGFALGLSVLLTGRATGGASLLISMILARGFGQSALSNVSIAIVGKWFVRRVNIAMAIYSILLSIGFVIAFEIVGHIVQAHGWRYAWWEMGLVLCFVFVPVMWLTVRDRPESMGLPVDGLAEAEPDSRSADANMGFTLAQAARTGAFWVFILASFIYGLAYTGLTLLYEAVFQEHGIDMAQARGVMGVLLMAGLVSNFLGGYLAERWSLGKLTSAAMLLLAGSMLMLPHVHGAGAGMAFAALFGLSSGTVMVIFFSCWNKAFGRPHVAYIQGAAQALTVLASALGPWLLELTRAKTHSYNLAFQIGAPLVAVLGIIAWLTPIPTPDQAPHVPR
jgi:MFS family permease